MVAFLDHISTLTDPTRCRILLLLERHELTVSELCAILQMPQSSVSRHLKTLADDRWVISRRDGTSRFYSMSPDQLDAGATQLWPIIRKQVSATNAAGQDGRRLRGVLNRRRATSRQFFATAAAGWDHLRDDLFGYTFQLWALLGLLDSSLVAADLGCGTGQLASVLAPFVRRIIAVDASAEMLESARRRLQDLQNVDVRQGELEALPIDTAQVDVAILSLVLHYSPDPAIALAEAARVTRQKGRLLVIDMQPHDRVEYQQQMGHVWLGFSERQIEKYITGAEFDDVCVRALPIDPDSKGPALFAATAVRR